jgi:phosphate-selective porin OprO/OprP
VKLTGFFQLDMGWYHQSEVNRATLGDIEDGLGFRRARLAASGRVTEQTSYLMEFDFAQAQPRFVDVWLQFDETPLGKLRIGRFRQPFGMNELTSVRELPFLERPLVFGTNVFFRQTGAMLSNTVAEDRVTWAVSGFRYLSDNFGNTYADDGGYGAAARITCLPINLGDRLLHLGVDYSYREPGRGVVQLANTNEFFLGQNPILGAGGLSVLPIVNVPAFVNTGPIAAQREQVLNLEGAIALGPLALQSEVRWATVEDNTGVVNTFPGAYVHVRYVLTGEEIPFNRSGAVFGRIKPNCPVDMKHGGWGAWELAARLSHLDLNGTNLPGPGRRLTDTTVGVNWYLNNYTKFQFNWIYADLNDPTLGDSAANTFALRGQLDF